MKSAFSSVMGKLWVSDKPEAPVAPAPVTENTTKPAPAPTMTAPVSFSSVAVGTNPEMLEEIDKAVQDANIEGYDYLELMQSVKDMNLTMLSQEQRIAAAFAAVARITTPEKIMSSIEHYLQIVDSTESSFMAAAQEKEEQEVVAREKKIEELGNGITEKSKLIQELTAEIQAMQVETSQLTGEKLERKNKIDFARSTYSATAKSYRDRLLNDKATIQRSIPGTAKEAVNG